MCQDGKETRDKVAFRGRSMSSLASWTDLCQSVLKDMFLDNMFVRTKVSIDLRFTAVLPKSKVEPRTLGRRQPQRHDQRMLTNKMKHLLLRRSLINDTVCRRGMFIRSRLALHFQRRKGSEGRHDWKEEACKEVKRRLNEPIPCKVTDLGNEYCSNFKNMTRHPYLKGERLSNGRRLPWWAMSIVMFSHVASAKDGNGMV